MALWSAPASACVGRCGDANADGKVNVADGVYIINFVFVPGAPPPQLVVNCGNANGSNDGGQYKIGIADASFIINYVFVPGSPAPGPCSPPSFPIGCCDF